MERVNNPLPTKDKRAVELSTEKGSSSWLTVIPLKELGYNLNNKGIWRCNQVTVQLGNNGQARDLHMGCLM